MNVSCLARGIYPLPQVRLTLGGFDLVQVGGGVVVGDYNNVEQDNTEILVQQLSYDVAIFKLVPTEILSSGRVFGCEVRLPGTSYLARQEAASCSCRTLHIKDRRQGAYRRHAAWLAGK